jgi:NAD(P)-dependent dehydrogenase (short-subunit alcohol dehydrogenase family)
MAHFDGKTAIVTGGASGIGQAIVRDLVRAGARVVIADLNGDAAEKLARELGKQTAAHKVDVADASAVKRMVAFAVSHFGALQLAVNNAGISGATDPLADFTLDAWHQVININLNGVFYGMKYEIPELLKAGGGAIVNMASVLGAVAWPGKCAYNTSKHALIGLTKSAALDYAKQGIRVNCVGPGLVSTGLAEAALSDEAWKAFEPYHPIGRFGRPEDVATLVTYLLSDQASFMTGGFHPVDGGYLAH